jgi:opacity protein-like surface antigen
VKHLRAAALAVALGAPAAAAAQPPEDRQVVTRSAETDGIAFRPFLMGTQQAFAAAHTFEAVFGRSHEAFYGGGLQVIVKGRYFAEIAASRFKKTGERAVRVNNENLRLGLPLTAEITPFEVIGGYRLELRPSQRIVPYAGAGIGTYAYKESSPSSDPAENIDTRHRGFVLIGGVEFRLHRWVRLGIDEQYTRVPGILGLGGISKAAGEDNLGGIAFRLKIVVGR